MSGDKKRNRQATEECLISAVGTILARDGFSKLGVNAVAKEAGVNNVLIYRYFGGLQGLVKAFGYSAAFWPSPDEIMGCDVKEFYRLDLAERYSRVVCNYFQALRNRPLTKEILAWELAEFNEATTELARIREDVAIHLLELIKPVEYEEDLNALDIEALGAVLGAACNYLVVRSRTVDVFNGIEINTDEGAYRLQQALKLLVGGIFLQSR